MVKASQEAQPDPAAVVLVREWLRGLPDEDVFHTSVSSRSPSSRQAALEVLNERRAAANE